MSISEVIDLWSTVATWISAIAATVTMAITWGALIIARKTLYSWKDKEKFMQLVRLKRAIFSYRQKVESVTTFNHDNKKINDYILNTLQSALSDVYHELKLAGFEESNSTEFQLFNKLWNAQKEYQQSQLNYASLLKGAVELQESIKVSFKNI
ncbi:hypothetical protein LCS18_002616 [Salmonella enterica]|nr:hypothetical protein [Salmonella enterica]